LGKIHSTRLCCGSLGSCCKAIRKGSFIHSKHTSSAVADGILPKWPQNTWASPKRPMCSSRILNFSSKDRNLFPRSPRGYKSTRGHKIKVFCQGWVPRRPLSLACRLGSTPMTSSYLNHLFGAPIYKYSRLLRY